MLRASLAAAVRDAAFAFGSIRGPVQSYPSAPMPQFKRAFQRLQKLSRVLGEPSYRRGLRHGVAASTEHEAIPFRRDFATVVDVGANRGQFALFAARSFPRASLICFEPLEQPRARLRRVMAHRSGFRVFEVAASEQSGTAEFHVSRADDSSSLLPIGQRQRESFPGTEEQATIRVEVRRLDEVLQATDLAFPALLKIDVQGGELGVLKGATAVLGSVSAILVEASFVELYDGQPLVDEVWRFADAAGFVCRGIWSASYGTGGECLQADFLFSRPDFDPLA